MVECRGTRLGTIVGESTPLKSLVLIDPRMWSQARAGAYMVVETHQGCVLGLLESLVSGSPLLPEHSTELEAVEGVVETLGESLRYYVRGRVRWMSLVDDVVQGRVRAPKLPPVPGAPVYLASPGLLSQIFSPRDGGGWVRLGVLETAEVEYRVDAFKLPRHLAILAVTGGGKSNTVCTLARRIVGDLGMTVAIFDMHGEYGDLGLGESRATVIESPGIHPLSLRFAELLRLTRMSPSATNQERLLRWAWKTAVRLIREGDEGEARFVELMKGLVEEAPGYEDNPLTGRLATLVREGKVDTPPRGLKPDVVQGVLNKLDDLEELYGDVISPRIDPRLEGVIRPGRLTVFDLSGLGEEGADAVVSHYLRRLLEERKAYKTGSGGYPSPVIVVVEEAHVLVPRDRDTLTKRWATRVVREGRKFGLGMVLVSQRPKNVDADVLSQTNNKIILRMVEPQDISYVQSASEELSQDLADLLPGLNPGEAIVIGSMTRLPGLVKIDYCEHKRRGSDIDFTQELQETPDKESLEARIQEML